MEEKRLRQIVPWQFTTSGIVLAFLFGSYILVLVSLYGNHLLKNKKDVKNIEKAYNIILVLSILFVIFFSFIFYAYLNNIIEIIISIPVILLYTN